MVPYLGPSKWIPCTKHFQINVNNHRFLLLFRRELCDVIHDVLFVIYDVLFFSGVLKLS